MEAPGQDWQIQSPPPLRVAKTRFTFLSSFLYHVLGDGECAWIQIGTNSGGGKAISIYANNATEKRGACRGP